MADDLDQSTSHTAFTASQKYGTLLAPPKAVQNPILNILEEYVAEGTPLHTGTDWLHHVLEKSISKGTMYQVACPIRHI